MILLDRTAGAACRGSVPLAAPTARRAGILAAGPFRCRTVGCEDAGAATSVPGAACG